MTRKTYTANAGVSDVLQVDNNRLLVEVEGTLSGVTIQLTRSFDGGKTFVNYPDPLATLTTVGTYNAYVAPGQYQLSWSGGGGTVNMALGLWLF